MLALVVGLLWVVGLLCWKLLCRLLGLRLLVMIPLLRVLVRLLVSTIRLRI